MRQGNDVGTQYRSAIYPTTPEQRAIAEESLRKYQEKLTAEGYGAITTEILDAPDVYFAQVDHQHEEHHRGDQEQQGRRIGDPDGGRHRVEQGVGLDAVRVDFEVVAVAPIQERIEYQDEAIVSPDALARRQDARHYQRWADTRASTPINAQSRL